MIIFLIIGLQKKYNKEKKRINNKIAVTVFYKIEDKVQASPAKKNTTNF